MSESHRGIINGAETATSLPCDPRKNPKNHTTRSKHPHRDPEIHMQLGCMQPVDMQPGYMQLGDMPLGDMQLGDMQPVDMQLGDMQPARIQ
jgi:hypothetical protein